MPDTPVRQHLPYSDLVPCLFFVFFPPQHRREPVLFFWYQKLSFVATVGKKKVSQNPRQYGRNALQNQQPPPTADSNPVSVIQYHARDWRANHARSRVAGCASRKSGKV